MAARSDHSRALPEGSASTSSTLLPARANTCASQTAEVVLPVPGFRLARARLRPVIQALCQQPRHYGQAGAACCRVIRAPELRAKGAGRTFPRAWIPAAALRSRPMSGTVGVARWTDSHPPLPFRAIRRLDVIVAPAGCGSNLGLPGCLFAPGSPGVTAPLASLPSSAAPPSLAPSGTGAPR